MVTNVTCIIFLWTGGLAGNQITESVVRSEEFQTAPNILANIYSIGSFGRDLELYLAP
jgi:hypothetical protein